MKLTGKDEENKKYEYTTKIELTTGGNYGYTFRVMPKHEMLLRSSKFKFSKMDNKIKILKRNRNKTVSFFSTNILNYGKNFLLFLISYSKIRISSERGKK